MSWGIRWLPSGSRFRCVKSRSGRSAEWRNSALEFGNLGTDMGVTAYTPTITSRPYRFGQGGRLNFSCGNPIIEALAATGATPTIAYIRDYGVETRSVTAPSLAATGSETRVAVKVEALKLADARVVQVQYTWDSDQFTTAGADLTGAILIPYKVQEPR